MKTKTGRCNVPCLHLLPSSDDLTNIVFSLAVAFVWLLKKSRFMWLYYLLVFLLLPPFISPWRMGHGLPVEGNQGQYNRGRGSLGPPNLWVSHASYVEYGQSLQGKKKVFYGLRAWMALKLPVTVSQTQLKNRWETLCIFLTSGVQCQLQAGCQ